MTLGAVAEDAMVRRARAWKPRTVTVNRSYLRRQILPSLGGRPVAEIDRPEVQRWMASLHATPDAANRSLPLLSVIMRHAELLGLRAEGSNPCIGVRRYRRRERERFLGADEAAALGRRLAALQGEWPLPASAVRLVALTGCRQHEVRELRWADYREGHLFLADAKAGPRTVWLSSAAREVLDALPRTSRWVFPAATSSGHLSTGQLDRFWREEVRAEAGLSDLRLHDLRHSYASFALRQGETVLTIGRLLGHRDPNTTLRYTHFVDDQAREAAEQVAEALT